LYPRLGGNDALVAKANWTYEVASAGTPAAGLEEYVVETTDGAHVGKVTVLLRRGADLILAVERGTPPVTHDVRAFPWREVESVDHVGLRVRLRLDERQVEESLELDAEKGTEGGAADAVRVTELPPELRPSASPAGPGPVDRPLTAVALGLGLIGVFSFLALAIAATAVDFDWEFALFAIPLAFTIGAALVAYRLFRNPYEGR
jgi:hypothetical protein